MNDGRTRRSTQPSLFDPAAPAPVQPAPAAPAPAGDDVLVAADAEARSYAVDPRNNVVLEASAGTGKTSVLVARYVNLLKAGVDPANVLAITFTRKAAGEMRERIVRELRIAAERGELDRERWMGLRDRLGDIAISTIDAFCLSLLREFPLEADVDPAFALADETEVPQLAATALDRALRVIVGIARDDADVALVLAQLGVTRTREGLAVLLNRRLVAAEALDRFLARGPRHLEAQGICRTAAAALLDVLVGMAGGVSGFLADGPHGHPRFALVARDVARLTNAATLSDAAVRSVLERVSGHFLTNEGKARKGNTIHPYSAPHYATRDAMRRHRDAVLEAAPRVERVMGAFNRDLNVVLARGIRRMFAIALDHYRRTLEERALLDFSDVLSRAVELLRRMDEFSQSRFRLESRYHHVLVDEFQDTSRAQWELVSLLVQAWGHGAGLAADPSIFVVGDRKQSIYRFRDADVGVLERAAQYIGELRPGGRARRSIARSFRAVPTLLHFVNDVFDEISGAGPAGTGAFRYDERDRFPVLPADGPGGGDAEPALGIAVADTPEACAAIVADEIARLLGAGTLVRDKTTGLRRPARPGDVGILFRSRSAHREFERELNRRSIPTHVYKGLGFFDADEIKDAVAMIRYLADPASPIRAAALLRSRFLRLSDAALALSSGDLCAVLAGETPQDSQLDAEDLAVLASARPAIARWLSLVDRLPPAELLDTILRETAYAWELRGPRRQQAWENLKKLRGLVRRIQNRGYGTMARIAEDLSSLSAGDESNAVVEALDSVSLMTVHAAKGLEFPIVFVVNLAKGATAPPQPVRVVTSGADDVSVSVGPFISDLDEGEREAERHETRRLLYVALTRARDRLYLASTLKEGAFVPGRGSLAEVLPESLKGFFSRAANVLEAVDTLGWTGTSGREYTWRLCREQAAPVGGAEAVAAALAVLPSPSAEDFDPPRGAPAPGRLTAGAPIGEGGAPADRRAGPSRSDRLTGTLVHRLLAAMDGVANPADPIAQCWRSLRDDERRLTDDPAAVVERAVEIWSAVRSRPDVLAALEGGERFFEVPFSLLRAPGEPLIRGTIDLVVSRDDGSLLVVEFKTGGPHPGHDVQLGVYVEAAQALFPERPARGALVYL